MNKFYEYYEINFILVSRRNSRASQNAKSCTRFFEGLHFDVSKLISWKISRVENTAVSTKVAYLFVLIGRHGDEFRLLENVTPERRVRKFQDVIGSHEVKPRLILVHRVQYRL